MFHGWTNNYTTRAMYVADLGWSGDFPVVRGSRVRYEVVNYPNTGWDTYQQVAVDVTLNAGGNTLRFTHLTAFAELDYVELA